MITVRNHRLLRLLGFTPVSLSASVGMSFGMWWYVVKYNFS